MILVSSVKAQFLVLILCAASLSGCFGSEDVGETMEAKFTYSPSSNIREDTTITFDASASVPSDGTLTYSWDFTGDGVANSVDKIATWVYAEKGSKVVTLTVSDGETSKTMEQTLRIISATAIAPTAEAGKYIETEDCFGKDVKEGNYYMFFICEMNLDVATTGDRDLSPTRTITLDATDSTPGGQDNYLTSWSWDFDLSIDEDGDGDPENDMDVIGENPDVEDMLPGEYKIKLTVENNDGLTDSEKVTIYVNYAAKWSDFEMNANNTNNAVDLDFEFPVVYNDENGNTIANAKALLTYPQQDSDCYLGESACRNKLDLWMFSEEQFEDDKNEDIANTSGVNATARESGDNCDTDENYCILLDVNGYEAQADRHDDGRWTLSIRNEEPRDIEVESLIFVIQYKYYSHSDYS